MNNLDPVELVRKVLEIHRIGPSTGPYNTDVSWVPRKCAGCSWIGWNHDQHVAEEVVGTVIKIVKEVQS